MKNNFFGYYAKGKNHTTMKVSEESGKLMKKGSRNDGLISLTFNED